MQRVFLDAGHGGADSGACALGLREKDVALDIVVKIKDILVSKGFEVDTTRVIDVYVPYQKVGAIANSKKSDIFVSVHCNASSLHNAQGFEVLHHTNSVEGKKLAEAIRQEFLKDRSLYTKDRALKPRGDLAVLNSTKMPAVLVECAFIDNPSDNFILRNKKSEIAQVIANGIFKYLGISEKGISENLGKTPILSKPTATLGQMKAFAQLKAPKRELSSLTDIYYLKAQALGINPVIAFSQMCHETGFLYQVKSAAGIDASYHNPCGLKISKGGGDFQASAHKKFDNWYDGISAHLDHLALYAGVDGYPKAKTLDPRHFAGIFGRVKYVEDLGGAGKWAPSEEYGNKILKIMKEIENTKVDDKMQINDLKNEPRIIPIILNGKNPTVTSVNIDGCEYVKLRDLATLGVFELSSQGKMPIITTK